MEANNLKILAICDNMDNLETLKAVVLDALPGCALLTALNEPQGVELARTEDPDVILLDGVMTGMDGYAVCRTLNRDERLRDIPVVFLTAPRTDRDSCVQALEAGAEAFLSQPLDKQELAAQVPAMARLKAANLVRRLEKEQLAALVAERTRELERESAERMRAEETQRASEELFRKLFEDHAAVKLLIDPDTGQIIDTNQAAAQFYGWSRDQLKKMKIQDINTQPPKRVREEMDRVRTRKETHFEFRHRRADGSIRDVDVLSSNIEANGKALLHSIIIDITERKQAEEELRILMARNEALLGSIPDIVVEVDRDKIYKWANLAGIEFYGEDCVGRESAHYFVGEQDTYDRVQSLFAGDEKTILVESWQLRRDGQKRLLSWWCHVLKDSHGNVTGALSTARDITERHEAETALRESEEKFRAFIENAPVAIGVSREGKTLYGNDVYLRMFGITKLEQVVGRPLTDLVAPQSRQEVAERAMRRARGEPAQNEFEMMAMRLDGLPFPCRVAVTALTFSDGPAALGFFFDLTAQKESEKKLEDSRSKLRNLAVHLLHAREEERKRAAREMHDELGQILTALKMDLQWIEKKLAPRSTEAMVKIHGAVALADQTIEIVHRISSELRPGMLDDLGLAAAIEWLGGEFSRRNGIPCRVDIAAPESRIGGNSSTALFRIVQEALANIARHADASHASVEILEADGKLLICVKDDGKGITEEQAASPLSLGLIGIWERVTALNGEMSITGRPGEGTILEVTIPLPSTGALA